MCYGEGVPSSHSPATPPIKAPSTISAVGGDRVRDGEGVERECTQETEELNHIPVLHILTTEDFNSMLKQLTLEGTRDLFGMPFPVTGKRNALFKFLNLFFFFFNLRDVGY